MNLLEIKWFTDARLTKKKLNNISSIRYLFKKKNIYIYIYIYIFFLLSFVCSKVLST